VSELRTGYTTGTCASAAAKAAAALLAGGAALESVEISLPGGARVTLPVTGITRTNSGARASVIKDAGDDPDITNGARVSVEVAWLAEGDVRFEAGEGVGVVTKNGLSVPPGEPAINPSLRRMITEALREVTGRPVKVTVSIEGGRELAEKTFNPKLGVEGGLSVLGTTGIVRPYSCPALRQSIVCHLDVALASWTSAPVFSPGNIGNRAAGALFGVEKNIIVEVSNEWGYVLDEAAERNIRALLAVGHPGKLAKLPMGHWDTHSKNSPPAAGYVAELAERYFHRPAPKSETVDGIFAALAPDESKALGDRLSEEIASAIHDRVNKKFPVAVALVNMKHELLGQAGDLTPWRRR